MSIFDQSFEELMKAAGASVTVTEEKSMPTPEPKAPSAATSFDDLLAQAEAMDKHTETPVDVTDQYQVPLENVFGEDDTPVQTKPEVKHETEVKPEAEVKTEAEVKLEAEVKPEPEVKSEPEVKPKAKRTRKTKTKATEPSVAVEPSIPVNTTEILDAATVEQIRTHVRTTIRDIVFEEVKNAAIDAFESLSQNLKS